MPAASVIQGVWERAHTHLESPFAELRSLSMQRHRLSMESVRLRNRVQGLLDVAWPEFVDCFSTIAAPTPLAVLRRWPLPSELAAAPAKTVEAVIRKVSRGHYGEEKVQELRKAARESVALTAAGCERRREILDLLERWALVRFQLAEVDAEIERQVLQYAPARALTTIPQLGAVGAATILSELGALDDYVHPRQVLKLAGMNLVEKSSGQLQSRRRAEQARAASAPQAAVPPRDSLVQVARALSGAVLGARGPQRRQQGEGDQRPCWSRSCWRWPRAPVHSIRTAGTGSGGFALPEKGSLEAVTRFQWNRRELVRRRGRSDPISC